MNAYAVLGLQTFTAAVAATGIWIVSRLRSPLRIEMQFQRERGFSIREIHALFHWKPGRTKRGFEWAIYLSLKSLPATAPARELALPSAPTDA
jgi:hypothetical protein